MIRFALLLTMFLQSVSNSVADDEPSSGVKPPPSKSTSGVDIQLAPNVVGRVQHVHGTSKVKGVPVVLVKADLANEPWWVQGAPIQSGSKFSAKALFGNARTPAGSRFRVCVIIVDPSKTYRTGQVIRKLPAVTKSDDLIVTLVGNGRFTTSKESGKGYKRNIEITSPEPNADVPRVATLKGTLSTTATPVILVRSLQEGSQWWIQDKPKLNRTGTFEAKVVFGSQSTRQGTRFRVVALAVESGDRDRFKVGKPMKELPAGIEASREVLVTLRQPTRISSSEAKSAASQ